MIHFAFVWILFALPLPLVMYYFKPKKTEENKLALKVPFYQLVAKEQTSSTDIKRSFHYRDLLLWLIWSLSIISAAQPEWLGEPISLPQEGRNILLAVDISGSMQIPDMILNHEKVDRLTAIKIIGNHFIDERQGDRLGLILFGSKAYLQTPLTFDLKTVKTMLNDASPGLAGQMTAIGDAIGLSIKRLMNYPAKSRVLILLTDGANNSGIIDPLNAAEMAVKQGIKIYTIGFGADKMMVPTILGNQLINPSSDLDEDTLQKIATMTHGQYFRAKNTETLVHIYDELNQLEPNNADKKIVRPVKALYPWPLGLALILGFYLMISRINPLAVIKKTLTVR